MTTRFCDRLADEKESDKMYTNSDLGFRLSCVLT